MAAFYKTPNSWVFFSSGPRRGLLTLPLQPLQLLPAVSPQCSCSSLMASPCLWSLPPLRICRVPSRVSSCEAGVSWLFRTPAPFPSPGPAVVQRAGCKFCICRTVCGGNRIKPFSSHTCFSQLAERAGARKCSPQGK